ncbi:MAG TPA: 7TM-DISM domain-containing protein, partial [Phnomibacter sp.]|nr:7TM-DISM domain-containing protein [Phnomibacter sp.]
MPTRPFLPALCLLLFLQGLVVNVVAQSVITLSSEQPDLLIGKSVYYLVDSNRNISFQAFASGRFDHQLNRYTMDAPNLGNKELAVWNKFTVVNKSDNQWVL